MISKISYLDNTLISDLSETACVVHTFSELGLKGTVPGMKVKKDYDAGNVHLENSEDVHTV